MEKGYVQMYTGDGKGKTTAALGLALRAVGAGLRVYIGQFMKNGCYSETIVIKERFPEVTLEQFGSECGFVSESDIQREDFLCAGRGYKSAINALTCGDYDVVILDEINVAAYFGLISEEDIESLIDQKPEGVELVLTGRRASDKIMRKCDLVSIVAEEEHYYSKGVTARKGIEE